MKIRDTVKSWQNRLNFLLYIAIMGEGQSHGIAPSMTDTAVEHTAGLRPEGRIRMGEKAIQPFHLLRKIQDDAI